MNQKPFHRHTISEVALIQAVNPESMMRVAYEIASLRASKVLDTYRPYFPPDIKLGWVSREEKPGVIEFFIITKI